MVDIDAYAAAGFALELLAASPYHKQHPVGSYMRTEILPAFRRGQVRYYLSENNVPTGMVTWAWLSEEVERDVHASGRSLVDAEWQSGDRLFFNDFVAPYGNAKGVLHELTHTIFPDRCASSLQRNMDGSVRKVQRWIGVNYGRPSHGEVVQ
jgi:cytolysin-activating lysine-acyltransferase